MNYNRHYLGKTVVDAAMERIATVYSLYDRVVCNFSGGKDSLAVLKLAERYMQESGRNEKINVLFYDEEVIPQTVVDFVKKYMDSGKYNFVWLCMQLKSEIALLGEKKQYIQWDEKREHVRDMPEWGTRLPGIISQSEMGKATQRLFPGSGKLCVMTGLRASESIFRLRAALRGKFPYPYISIKSVSTAKPIYDWVEKDVFKFLEDSGVRYCPEYDKLLFSKQSMRVSTPLHAEAASNATLAMKEYDPEFFDRISRVFTGLDAHVRYKKEMERAAQGENSKFPHTWAGALALLYHTTTPGSVREHGIATIRYARETRGRLQNEIPPFGGYPLRRVFSAIRRGAYKRFIPITPIYSKEDYDFEGIPYPGRSVQVDSPKKELPEYGIRRLTKEEFSEVKRMGLEKERVSLPGEKTVVFGAVAEESGEIIGVVGAEEQKDGLRYKCDFVRPEYRGQGVYSSLWREREKEFPLRDGTTAFCTSMSLGKFLAEGFSIISEKKGISRVIYNTDEKI